MPFGTWIFVSPFRALYKAVHIRHTKIAVLIPLGGFLSYSLFSVHSRFALSIKPFRVIFFEFLYQVIIWQTEVAVSGIEENIFIDLFSLLVGEAVRAVGCRIRHKDIKQACSRDYQFLALVASHDTAGVIHAHVVDFSCNHIGIVFMLPAPLTAQGAVYKSVYVNPYKVLVVNQQIVVAVATAAILLAKSGFDVTLAIISVVLVGYLYP